MSRNVRHINADDNEWVVVHRNRRSDNESGCGCIILIIILVALLGGC